MTVLNQPNSQAFNRFFSVQSDPYGRISFVHPYDGIPREIKALIDDWQRNTSTFLEPDPGRSIQQLVERVNAKERELLDTLRAVRHDIGEPLKYIVVADDHGNNYLNVQAAHPFAHPA